jgi:hypothetical protein
MRPIVAYRRLNKLIWNNRLPAAKIVLVDDSVMPKCHGLTLDDADFTLPIIFLNTSSNHWQKTLVHEALHVAEPELHHGWVFEALVEGYWRRAKKEIKGLK